MGLPILYSAASGVIKILGFLLTESGMLLVTVATSVASVTPGPVTNHGHNFGKDGPVIIKVVTQKG